MKRRKSRKSGGVTVRTFLDDIRFAAPVRKAMKTFTWYDQDAAANCRLSSPHAHICIRTPGCLQSAPLCGQPKLKMAFYDLDPVKIRRSSIWASDPNRGAEFIAGCMTQDQAERIVAFLNEIPDVPVFVNCEAGISRSPAIVLALRCYFGGDTDEPLLRAVPNTHVVMTMARALRKSYSEGM